MKLTISQEEYEKLRRAGQSKEEILSKYSEGSEGGLVKAAKAITKFVGAEGIAEQYGASLARTQLKMQGDDESANLVENPSLKKVIGSAIQTGANFIPGVGAGAGLGTKVAAGAATGYAYDVGSNLQLERDTAKSFQPGIGTVVGASLPLLGKILGASSVKQGTGKVAQKLEDINTRMTPTERQLLEKKGSDVVKFMAEKKIVGTPQSRYAKLNAIYNQMEGKIQTAVDKTKVTIPKDSVLKEIQKMPDQFVDDPDLYTEALTVSKKLTEYLTEKKGDNLTMGTVNNLKRNYMKRAFAKNATDVLSESRLAVGGLFNDILRTNVQGLKSLNTEYGNLIAARKILRKAATRSEIGLVGKLTGAGIGGAIGNAIGGPIGGAAGLLVAQPIGKAVAGTPTRSAIGAGFQTISNIAKAIEKLPTDELGNISKKALLNYLEGLKSDQ